MSDIKNPNNIQPGQNVTLGGDNKSISQTSTVSVLKLNKDGSKALCRYTTVGENGIESREQWFPTNEMISLKKPIS
jgi:hypothetical protein